MIRFPPENISDGVKLCLLSSLLGACCTGIGCPGVELVVTWNLEMHKERFITVPDEMILVEDYDWEPIPFESPKLPPVPALHEPRSWNNPRQVTADLLRQHPQAEIRAVADDIEQGVLDVVFFTGEDASVRGMFEVRDGVPTIVLQPAVVAREGYQESFPEKGILPFKIVVVGHEARHYLQWRQSPENFEDVWRKDSWLHLSKMCTSFWTIEEEAWWEMCSEAVTLGAHIEPVCNGAPGNRQAFDQLMVLRELRDATQNAIHWYGCGGTWLQLAGHPAYQ